MANPPGGVPAGGQILQAHGIKWRDGSDATADRMYFDEQGNIVVSIGSLLYAPTADKGGQVFNVKAYGAKGDAATDDTVAIQAAITAAGNAYRAASATGGGVVYFPPGLYYISSPLTMSVADVALEGGGPEMTSIAAGSGFTGAAMVIGSAARQRIANLTLHGEAIAATLIQVNSGAGNHYVRNCRLTSSTSQCVVYTDNTANSTYTIIEDCDLGTTAPASVATILMDPPTPPSIGGSQRSIIKCTAAGGILVDVNACNTLQVIGCSGNITFSQTNNAATKCIFIGNRIPGATTVYGSNLVLVGNMSSSGFTLGSGSNGCILYNSVGVQTVNNSAGNNFIIDGLFSNALHDLPGTMKLGTALQVGTNPAQSGTLRMPNGTANGLYGRTNANNNDLQLVALDTNNNLIFGQHALGGTVTAIDTPTGGTTDFLVNGIARHRMALAALTTNMGDNGQSIAIQSVSEATTIAAAATTTTAMTIPAGAIVLAVNVRVTVAIPTAATFTVTGDTSGTVFDTAAVGTTLGSTDAGTAAGAFYNSASQKIRFTPNLTPGAATGQVRVTVFYLQSTAPTS